MNNLADNPDRLDDVNADVASSGAGRSSFSIETEGMVRGALGGVMAALDEGNLPSALAAMEALPRRAAVAEYAELHAELPAGIRELVPYETYVSDSFVDAALKRNMSLYQWAGVEALRLQGIAPFRISQIEPEGDRSLRMRTFFSESDALRVLPDHLHVIGDLEIHGAPHLRALPSDLWVEDPWAGGELIVTRSGIRETPAGLRCRRLHIADCPDFARVAPGIMLGDSMRIESCPAFRELPPDLAIPGNLALALCPAFGTIPERLRVGGDFMLSRGCCVLDIPDSLSVGGQFSNWPARLHAKVRALLDSGKIGILGSSV